MQKKKKGEHHRQLRSHFETAAADSCGKKKLWNSEFAEKFHDSDGCALSKDEGSNYNGYDSPNC